MTLSLGAALLAIVLAAGPAPASIVTPISSTRVVSVVNRETNPQTSQSFTGPQFGSWQAQAYASNDSSNPNYNQAGSIVAVTSSQQSTFSPSGVTFTGFVFIDYSSPTLPNNGVSAADRCDTVFHIDGPCPYQFQTAFTSNNVSETAGIITLQNNATMQNVFSITASDTRAGTLPTGDYTLSIVINGIAMGFNQTFDGRTQVDAALTVPAPGGAALLGLFAIFARRRAR
jgi:hypothetical protein